MHSTGNDVISVVRGVFLIWVDWKLSISWHAQMRGTPIFLFHISHSFSFSVSLNYHGIVPPINDVVIGNAVRLPQCSQFNSFTTCNHKYSIRFVESSMVVIFIVALIVYAIRTISTMWHLPRFSRCNDDKWLIWLCLCKQDSYCFVSMNKDVACISDGICWEVEESIE